MTEPDIDAILRSRAPRNRWVILSLAGLIVIAAAVAAFLLTRSGQSDVVFEPEKVDATWGRLTTEVDLSGSAVSERTAELSFEVSGIVASVEVERGDAVKEGEPMASLFDQGAQRRVETAEVQLLQAQLRLEELLADPMASRVAASEQSVITAKAQLLNAELALDRLIEPATVADLASAQQAVATARRELSSAEQALELLTEPASAADVAGAEQAVANALVQVSSAERALSVLFDPPQAGELSSREESVANALLQLSAAEEELADLKAGHSPAEVEEAQSAVTQAQVRISAATTLAEQMREALNEAAEDFCDRYSGLSASDEVIRVTCATELPLSDSQVNALRDSFEDRSASYESFGAALIDANTASVAADADRDSAASALSSAVERLSGLLQPLPEEDVFQAERALEAARANYDAATSHLEDLRAAADEEEIYEAQQTLEAAKASHEAAVARLEDLRSAADDEDVYQAQQAVEAAKANHASAVARLDDLESAADAADVEQAKVSLESAQAGLASAQAQFDELVAGPTPNAVEQQRQDVRLSELTLEEAQAALTDLTVFAPFDGIVEDVRVRPGDNVGAGFAAFTLSTTDRMLIELTVTEEDLLELEVGQSGSASFDAIDGVSYPVRVESVSRMPNAEQGVVTYEVEARILSRPAAQSAPPRAAGSSGGGFGGAAGGPFAGFQLPEGVTAQQVRQAVIAGEPLPEGVELPEELMQMVERVRSGGGFPAGAASQPETAGPSGNTSERPLPAPGMSARVTIITELRDESVLLPTSAVRQLNGQWFVSIPTPASAEGESGFDRVFVEVGASDGENVEITSGLDAGAIVLIGADSEGIAFTATLQQPSASPGFGPGSGGFGPGGGGGRR